MLSPVKIWRRQKEIRELLGLKGKIISWTKIFVTGPDFKKQAPYVVVLVNLENGRKAVGQLVDCYETSQLIGKKVIGVLRKIRITSPEEAVPYGLKFSPLS